RTVQISFPSFIRFLILLFSLLTFTGIKVNGQDSFSGDKRDTSLVYDDIPVRVLIEGIGSFYIDALYTSSDLLFVNVGDLFTNLKIQCMISQDGDSIGGFTENEGKTYLINYHSGQIEIGNKRIEIRNGLLKEFGAVYMETSLFSETFGLSMSFNYRALTLEIKSNFELPILKQKRLEKLQLNLTKLKGEATADTLVQRKYHIFKPGNMDWSITSIQKWPGLTENYLRLGLGTELFFGEANISIDYSNRYPFDDRQLRYLWRWVDNDKRLIKQAQIGKINDQPIAFINSPIIGAAVRNTPTTVRKANGYYSINDHTEPNWTVELYINDVLIDFTKADASGLYVFKVPIVYGYTTLKLKFYGPMGEERTDERIMNVPYTIMPAKEFEYGLSGGFVEDSTWSRYGKADFNYGVSRLLTVGGGLEYLSSISSGNFIPYAKATFQPFGRLIVNAEYAYRVRFRGMLNYFIGKNVLLEMDYSKYADGQMATRFNASEERKVKLSAPFRMRKISGFARLEYSQMIYPDFYFNQGSFMLSAYYKQLSINSSTQFNWIGQRAPYATSDFALSYRFNRGFVFRPSAQINLNDGNFVMIKAEIEKRMSKAYVSVSLQRNIANKSNYINLSIRYDLSFARANISAFQSNGIISTSESAQGSLAFGGDKYIHVSNNSSVSKGGILLYPFLDLNQNGIRDNGERLVKIASVKIGGGRAIFSKKDSIVRIPDLNAFISYTVEFADNDLENISWRFKNKVYSILVDPNQFKRVDVPVIAVGEASGMAYMDKNNVLKGIGKILIKFYKRNSNTVIAGTLSESDGYIDYMGLAPGDYVACVDSAQLTNLDFTVDPLCRAFTIKATEQGDIVNGLDFVLRAKLVEPAKEPNEDPEPDEEVPEPEQVDKQQPTKPMAPGKQQAETKTEILQEPPSLSSKPGNLLPDTRNPKPDNLITDNPITDNLKTDNLKTDNPKPETLFKVQLLASRKQVNVRDYFAKVLAGQPGLTIVETPGADGYYRYTAGTFVSMTKAKELMSRITLGGWKECFIAVERRAKP
ncbi:MAG: SPOR domain-containing protein, partial [Bacteroidia bacterium]|nr:SPOR domain-containing protein [Bacteroidia bacterium]